MPDRKTVNEILRVLNGMGPDGARQFLQELAGQITKPVKAGTTEAAPVRPASTGMMSDDLAARLRQLMKDPHKNMPVIKQLNAELKEQVQAQSQQIARAKMLDFVRDQVRNKVPLNFQNLSVQARQFGYEGDIREAANDAAEMVFQETNPPPPLASQPSNDDIARRFLEMMTQQQGGNDDDG